MTTTRKYQAFIEVTSDELAAVAAVVGPENVKRLVMGDNGIPAFHHEGPTVLEQIAPALSETERSRLKSWDELDDDTRESILSIACGCHEWTENPPRLDAEYVADVLDCDPEFKEALLHPADHQRGTNR